MIFSPIDIEQIQREGLSVALVEEQLALFRRGVSHSELLRPCRTGDGIEVIDPGMEERLTSRYEQAAAAGRCLKFVPASGAASRMFKDWFQGMEEPWRGDDPAAVAFLANLPRYPFYEDLRRVMARRGEDPDACRREGRYESLLSYILTSRGLDYGRLPKALLKFHRYPDGSRTALEEHLTEAALYATDNRRVSRLHVTVSPEHRLVVTDFLQETRPRYEALFGLSYDVAVSCQETATNTIAVDMDKRPFRTEKGRLYFRPGGHGALLGNMNELDGDIVFLKNIDNVVPDRLKGVTVCYKKLLAGLLLERQEEIFRHRHSLEGGHVDGEILAAGDRFCRERLHIVFPDDYRRWPPERRKEFQLRKLDRPIRVCGVVRNEGEPGGGPFWVRDADGGRSLQIVEEVQVDPHSESQQAIWGSASHFNPVDLVCGIRDYRGRKYDLRRFVDPGAVSIARKSEKGRDLQALELPGLWNGSMADWNTIFVEVPIATFNPVKTVADLLRPERLWQPNPGCQWETLEKPPAMARGA
ncbi:MAG: DUF4301 family protein [Pseudomonadota bacterium]|nr:DUF4301 family protein [Pseudomonadota bacterium]